MKETTHYIFSIGLAFYLLSLFHMSSLASYFISTWLSIAVNFIIDALGHFSRKGIPIRSRVTHSVFTAPVWGGVMAWLSIAAISDVSGWHQTWPTTIFWIAMGVLIAFGHLLLDSMTQAGIYSLKKRRALAHFSYDNPFLNYGFALIGVALFVVSFLT